MDKEIIDLRRRLLAEFFEPAEAGVIVDWLIAAEHRRPVLLVGAGFSRNARHRYRGDYARASEVPLWTDVTRLMATHLGVTPEQYDGPTMAEMYVSSFGDAELRDRLRGMLSDEDIDPGEAHLALARYDAEAVITTNCLDTLLDRATGEQEVGWNRVIGDADLSATTRGERRLRDLIYFHGHRCASDTWILTRSQYEDVTRTRPVMVARVRQLVAQHPLLILGFGLGDPNFHNVYRQVSNEMRRHQPVTLAVQFSQVSEAEKRHWEKLGVRTVVPKAARTLRDDPAGANAFFVWLFGQLATSWSPGQEEALQYVLSTPEVSARLSKFAGVFPHLWKGIERRGHFSERAAAFNAWRRVLFSCLPESDETAAQERVREAVAYEQERFREANKRASTIRSTDGPEPTPSADKGPGKKPEAFAKLPAWRSLRPTEADAWRLDYLLRRDPDQKAIADHFALALEPDLFQTGETEDERLPWIPLTCWLVLNAHAFSSDERRRLVNACFARADHYGDEAGSKIIRGLAAAAIPPVVVDATDDSARTDTPEAQGFTAMLDGDFRTAQERYRQAADRARAASLEFEEWAWRQGQQHGLTSLIDDWRSEPGIADPTGDLRKERDACRERIKALSETETVRSWLDRTKTRIRGTLERALNQRRSQETYRARGGSGVSFSNVPHMAWRSFRDLEAIHAPPGLQAEYLAPLLWEGGFARGDELEYRMQFDGKNTENWLDDVLDAPSATPQAQAERDAAVVEAFWNATRKGLTRTEREGQILAVPGLESALRAADVPELARWLGRTLEAMEVRGPADEWPPLPYVDHSAGINAVASLAASGEVQPIFERWRADRRLVSRDGLAKATYSLPWAHWAMADPVSVASWIHVVSETALLEGAGPEVAGSDSGPPPLQRRDELTAFALYHMAVELHESAPELLDDQLRRLLARYADDLRARSLGNEYYLDARHAGFLLELTLDPSLSHRDDLLDRWSVPEGWTSVGTFDRRELHWSLIASAIVQPYAPAADHGPLLRRLEQLWEDTLADEKWNAVENRYRLNPHHAAAVIRFLATCLLALPHARATAARRVLRIVDSAPLTLPILAPTLERKFWGDSWGALVDRVLESAGGAQPTRVADSRSRASGAGTEHQIGAFDLWTECTIRKRRMGLRDGDGVEVLWDPLRFAATIALADDRTAVAHRAANGLVAAAEVASGPPEVEYLVPALRRMARDTRTRVRMVAAYAGSRLATLAASSEVRATAVAISRDLADDPNAMIGRYREQGRLEAERLQRRRGAPTDANSNP
jgi:hypothetical protein